MVKLSSNFMIKNYVETYSVHTCLTRVWHFLFDEISHGKDAGSTTSRPTNQQLQ